MRKDKDTEDNVTGNPNKITSEMSPNADCPHRRDNRGIVAYNFNPKRANLLRCNVSALQNDKKANQTLKADNTKLVNKLELAADCRKRTTS